MKLRSFLTMIYSFCSVYKITIPLLRDFLWEVGISRGRLGEDGYPGTFSRNDRLHRDRYSDK
jgi:hypothetical protein